MGDLSDKQLKANRENAKKGGVKSPEGKEISKMNAQKHSVLTKAMTKAEGALAAEVQKRLRDELQPEGFVEETLVERMSVIYVRLQRSTKAEAEQVMRIHNPRVTETTGGLELETFGARTEVIKEGYTPKVGAEDVELLGKTYLRYDAELERSFFRTLHELQRAQAARKGEKPPSSVAVDVDLNRGD